MDNTSELILRNREAIRPDVLLVNPPDVALLSQLARGHFVSLHYGQWKSLCSESQWTGHFGLDCSLEKKVSHAIIWMPKARQELDLLQAWVEAQLLPGARLWLVGPKRGGIESGGRALKKKLGLGNKLDSARHCQLWEYSVNELSDLFELDQWILKRESWLTVAGREYPMQIAELHGVFSQGRLDEGTQLLLDVLPEELPGPVLDFGCGAGVIGAAIARQWPGAKVTLLDVQWQALVAARRTFAVNDLPGEVIAGNGLAELAGRFGTIVTNPPFHTGLNSDLDIMRRFAAQAKSHLLPGGILLLVANAFLPYREILQEHFTAVETVTENNRYRVYCARNK